MAILSIERDDERPNELVAKLDGVQLPLTSCIKIISVPRDLTTVEISFVCATTSKGDAVIIKEYENKI